MATIADQTADSVREPDLARLARRYGTDPATARHAVAVTADAVVDHLRGLLDEDDGARRAYALVGSRGAGVGEVVDPDAIATSAGCDREVATDLLTTVAPLTMAGLAARRLDPLGLEARLRADRHAERTTPTVRGTWTPPVAAPRAAAVSKPAVAPVRGGIGNRVLVAAALLGLAGVGGVIAFAYMARTQAGPTGSVSTAATTPLGSTTATTGAVAAVSTSGGGETQSMPAALALAPRLKLFDGLLRRAGLDQRLADGDYTLVAANDRAVKRARPLPTGDELRSLLEDHIIPRRLTAAEMVDGARFETLAGTTLLVRTRDGQTFVGKAPLTGRTIETGNGTILIADALIGGAGAPPAEPTPTETPVAPPPAASTEPPLIPAAVGDVVLLPIRFGPGSAGVPYTARRRLHQLASELAAGGVRIEIDGHTDNDGDPAANLALSQRRADAVRAYLVAHGAPEDAIVARGFGDRRPVADNETPAGRKVNRRIEIRRLA